MPAETSSRLLTTLLWRPAVYNRSQLGGSWKVATRQFYEPCIVDYFPNWKRFTYKRHIFQRFLLLLKGNSSFHFLCCIAPSGISKTHLNPPVTSSLTFFLCPLSSLPVLQATWVASLAAVLWASMVIDLARGIPALDFTEKDLSNTFQMSQPDTILWYLLGPYLPSSLYLLKGIES